MKLHELQHVVLAEGIALALIGLIILAGFKRWRKTIISSCALASIAFYCAWSNIMALGSMLVYGSASALLWWQLDKKNNVSVSRTKKYLQAIMWPMLAIGVVTIIFYNTRNIIFHLLT